MDEPEQQSFPLAVEAIHLSAFYSWPNGWSLEVRSRRQHQTWTQAGGESYRGLTTAELSDLLELVTPRALEGLSADSSPLGSDE